MLLQEIWTKIKEKNEGVIIRMSNADNYRKLDHSVILITGATGFLGSEIVHALVNNCREIKIIALTRNKNKAMKMFGCHENVMILESDIGIEINVREKVDYIIHGAAVTESKQFVDNPVDTILANVMSTKNVLEYAANTNLKKMVFLSSMEIYGTKGFESSNVTEVDYGYVDILNPRSSYPESKRLCETMCASYKSQKNVPVTIARLCQVFGPKIQEDDQRMFAHFLKTATQQKDIVLATEGITVRGYCYIHDAVSAILTLLVHGEAGEAYSVCNEAMTMSVKEVAKIIAKYTKVNVRVELKNTDSMGFLPPFQMKISAEKIRKLGWNAKVNMEEAIQITLDELNYKMG